MNVLNSTQFSGSYTGGLGGTVTTANPALGLVPGMGNANNYGTRGHGDLQSAADDAARDGPILDPALPDGGRSVRHSDMLDQDLPLSSINDSRAIDVTAKTSDQSRRHEEARHTRNAVDPEPGSRSDYPRSRCRVHRAGGPQATDRTARHRPEQHLPAREHAAPASIPGQSRRPQGIYPRPVHLAPVAQVRTQRAHRLLPRAPANAQQHDGRDRTPRRPRRCQGTLHRLSCRHRSGPDRVGADG